MFYDVMLFNGAGLFNGQNGLFNSLRVPPVIANIPEGDFFNYETDQQIEFEGGANVVPG